MESQIPPEHQIGPQEGYPLGSIRNPEDRWEAMLDWAQTCLACEAQHHGDGPDGIPTADLYQHPNPLMGWCADV